MREDAAASKSLTATDLRKGEFNNNICFPRAPPTPHAFFHFSNGMSCRAPVCAEPSKLSIWSPKSETWGPGHLNRVSGRQIVCWLLLSFNRTSWTRRSFNEDEAAELFRSGLAFLKENIFGIGGWQWLYDFTVVAE